MKYYSQVGNRIETYYALNEADMTLVVMERRFFDDAKEFSDCIVVSICSAANGTYDVVGAQAIRGYMEISAREFNAVKKEFIEFTKKAEDIE